MPWYLRWRPAIIILSLLAVVGLARPAAAVPSFASQTGQPCSACHIGAFGPQLTPFGRQFKLDAYADGENAGFPPLSAMILASYTHVAKDVAGGLAPGFGDNNAVALDQASVFYGGRIMDDMGAMAQVTWDGVAHHWTWDNTDIRYARTVSLWGEGLTAGVTVNNNPSVQDIYSTSPAWRFPYASSALAAGPPASTLIEGALAQEVVGMGAYGLYANHFYGEVSAYVPLAAPVSDSLGANIDGGPKLTGGAPYVRFAYQNDRGDDFYNIGVIAMLAHMLPTGVQMGGPTDFVKDVGVDGSYQFYGDSTNIVTVDGSFIHEERNQDASALLGLVDHRFDSLNSTNIDATYHYDNTYGLSVIWFDRAGTADRSLYASANGSADTAGWTFQMDWTPFGKEDSPYSPWVNLKVGLQYTHYTRFDGSVLNYDGAGTNASNNDALYLNTWWAF